MKNLFLTLVFMSFGLISTGVEALDHTHKDFSAVLQDFVHLDNNRSVVDYKALKEQPGGLDRYLASLQSVTLDEFRTFTKDQQLAFLINAYNGFTLKLIISHYPISSIRKIGGISGPWKVKFFDLLGEKKHLDDIEHNMIRKMFKEPRIHFAVNCASRGCPDLSRSAYEASSLESQLEEATRNFLEDSSLNRLSTNEKQLEVSSILTWFKSDFISAHGSLQNFLTIYVPLTLEQKGKVLSGEIGLKFLDYDWSLNEIKQE